VFEIQFKYGDTRLYEFRLGEKLEWGGNSVGEPNCRKVLVEGLAPSCPNCQAEHLFFDISLEGDVLLAVAPFGIEPRTWPDTWDGNYLVLRP
jgi:hypothetical protein